MTAGQVVLSEVSFDLVLNVSLCCGEKQQKKLLFLKLWLFSWPARRLPSPRAALHLVEPVGAKLIHANSAPGDISRLPPEPLCDSFSVAFHSIEG